MITPAIKTSLKEKEINRLWALLKYTFGLVPIVAGLDKFSNILVTWSNYLDLDMIQMLPISASSFMLIIGVIEIAAGIIVLVKTELGAYLVSAWLLCIAVSLLISGNHLDVAVRDIVMAIGAYTLGRLSNLKDQQ